MLMVKKIGLFSLLLTLALTSLSLKADENPHDLLVKARDDLIGSIEKEREIIAQQPTHLFTLVEQSLLPYVDVETMSRMVLAANWRKANPEQRQQFTEQFKNLLIRFYVGALLEDPQKIDELLEKSDSLITFFPNAEGDDRKVRVRAEVTPVGRPPIPVSFSLFNKEGEWKIYDVNVEGISIIINYRKSFAQEVAQHGIDGVIANLSKKNDELLKAAEQPEAGEGESTQPSTEPNSRTTANTSVSNG